VRVWLDTAHAFGAGWDLRDGAGVDRFAADIARAVGWDRIAGIHANDSKVDLGSRKDRHENIGLGRIGDAGFKALLAHPSFARLPFILETPGLDGEGPDLPNMRRLKGLRGDPPAAL
jgi:deoxyribonuclease-4